MATLVLTVVGSVLGGPIGGAIGAAVGQQIDSRLFAPKPRQGPRLGELSFQSSTYGAPLPKIFGRARVAGSIIWATDIKEDRRRVSTGKGRPKQTVYSYSASFAVALSARKISRIGRIWADGKLLRGDAGDFKTQTLFRVHLGAPDQGADPLIVATEGAGSTPAYRGLAYAVFEEFQLADYGNRIPSLSFEVFADETPISISTILDDQVAAGLSTQCPTLIDGIAVTGDSVRAVAETLSAVAPLYGWDSATGLLISESARAGPVLVTADLGARGSAEASRSKPSPAFERERLERSSLGGRRTILYYDVDRDYLQGSQSVLRPDLGNRERRIELAASLSAVRAKALAARSFANDAVARDQIHLLLGFRFLGLAPAMVIAVPGLTGQWMVHSATIEGMTVKAALQRVPLPLLGASGAESGRGVFEADLVQGASVIHLIDLPGLGSDLATTPSVAVVAAGASTGWRQAALLQSGDGGLSFDEIGLTAPSAVMGVATTLLGPSTALGFDGANAVEVTLLNAAMDLSNTSRDGLVAGQNLALIGNELVQFETATPLGPNRFLLSNLLRGRRGSEYAIPSHAIGERFILLNGDTIRALTVPSGAQSVTVTASGLGDIVPVSATLSGIGEAVRPLSPVHMIAARQANGDTLISWGRRSRDGWRWIDGVDAPLGEESEAYEVGVDPSPAQSRATTVQSGNWLYTAAARAADAAAGAAQVTVSVQQIGTYGRSRPAILIVSTL